MDIFLVITYDHVTGFLVGLGFVCIVIALIGFGIKQGVGQPAFPK